MPPALSEYSSVESQDDGFVEDVEDHAEKKFMHTLRSVETDFERDFVEDSEENFKESPECVEECVEERFEETAASFSSAFGRSSLMNTTNVGCKAPTNIYLRPPVQSTREFERII